MKTLFRWAFRLFLLLLVLLAAGVLLLDSIARSVAENRIRSETGLEARIGSLSIGLWSPELTIENFKLYNSAEFGGSPLIDLPELHIEYDRRALFSRRLHCRLVRLSLAELNVVFNKSGKSNLQALKDYQHKSGTITAGGTGSKTKTPFFAGIETLNLSAGKATRLSMNTPGKVQEVKLDIRHLIVTDIKTENDLETKLAALLLTRGGMPLVDLFSKDGK